MPNQLPDLAMLLLPYLFWGLLWAGLAIWVHKELTPKRFMTLFESENSLSIRLVLATIVVAFTLWQQTKTAPNVMLVEANYTFAAVLLGLGAAKIVGKAFAERAPDTTVNAKKAEVKGETVTVNGTETTDNFPPGGPRIS